MMPFNSVHSYIWGLVGTWIFLLLFGFILLEAFLVIYKQGRMRYLLPVIAILIYCMLQSVICLTPENASVEILPAIIRRFVGMPWFIIILICVVLTLLLTLLAYRLFHWQRNNITNMSIKHAVDVFPEGICYYDASGLVWLKNHTMERLSRITTGDSLVNGVSFYSKLSSSDLLPGCDIQDVEDNHMLVIAEDTIFSVTKKQILYGLQELSLLIAADITEEYRKTEELLIRQKQLRRLNRKLKEYNQEITSIISAREILNAKVRIHDELGISLLTSKRYILSGGTDEEKNAIIDSLRQNIMYLKCEMDNDSSDEYTLLLKTAGDLGMRVNLEGTIPKETELQHLTVTAIHECLTNTVRHAHGDMVRVHVEETFKSYTIRLTNNGLKPQKPIAETGGLASLRKMIEKCGGNMKIDWKDGFLLTIELPKEIIDEN